MGFGLASGEARAGGGGAAVAPGRARRVAGGLTQGVQIKQTTESAPADGGGGGAERRELYAVTIAASPVPVPREHRLVLSGRVSGITAARSAARKSPGKATASERRFAARVEKQRNASMRFLAKLESRNAARRARAARAIARLGAKPARAQLLADAVLVHATPAELAKIRRLEDVAGVSAFELPHALATTVDGSPTWHAAGFNGQANNPDFPSGADGPDVVTWDQSISTGHQIFNTRLPGDCSTCAGTGPSQDQGGPGGVPRAAAGAHTRVFSPPGRTDWEGSLHGNLIAAAIAGTDFALGPGGKGIAYGIDKLYDPNSNIAFFDHLSWVLGITAGGHPGVPDLPEAWNYSAGIYQDTVPYNPSWMWVDRMVDVYGITYVNSAGNCGQAGSIYIGCNSAYPGQTHRISTPGNGHNLLTVGGMQTCPDDAPNFCVWPNSSAGPTWDGRKKPDLIATPGGNIGCPRPWDDDNNGKLDDYGAGCGTGTSYAAPQVTAAAALLASVGVYSPIAQRAILINNAKPIQGQTYWTPTSGWGALDLATTFPNRGNYVTSSVHGAGPNSARFFEVSGVAAGERVTLTWNRRQQQTYPEDPSVTAAHTYRETTNLDLSQISPADPSGQTITSTGGSDAGDSVDTNTVASGSPGNYAPTDNPMPPSGEDGEDNIEQIRSTASGTQLLKVKAHSAVDGQPVEPFALAANHPITALETPIPAVVAAADSSLLGVGGSVTITASVTNPSSDLPLEAAQLALGDLPAGLSASSPTAVNLGTIAPGASASTTFTVVGTTSGVKTFEVVASGSTYGEAFAGRDDVTVTFDSDPPVVELSPLPEWSTNAEPTANWSASDPLATVASYDVETSVAGGGWVRVLDASPATTLQLAGGVEGQTIAVRVRARDARGNTSEWVATQTVIDAIGPTISFGPASFPRNDTVNVSVGVSNVGAPIASKSYSWHRPGSLPAWTALVSDTLSYANPSTLVRVFELSVTATDVLGRSVALSQGYTLQPKSVPAKARISPKLKLSKIRVKRRLATITGTVRSGVRGTVRITVTRRGKKGTKRATGRVKLKNRRFTARVRLTAGSYKVRADLPSSTRFKTGRAQRNFRVR